MSQLLLSALIWTFSFWMVADVMRRGASFWWIVVILLTQPFGGLVYLVYIKVQASPWGGRWLGRAHVAPRVQAAPRPGAAPDPLGELLHGADRLEERQQFAEAALVYRKALDDQPEHPRALHGLARCLVELGELEEGVERYEALMAVDPRYRNYSAALEYAEALHRSGRTPDAAELLEGMVGETQRLNHRLALAHYLEASGQKARAQSVLNEALDAYERSPALERQANRHWQRRIADKLQELAAS